MRVPDNLFQTKEDVRMKGVQASLGLVGLFTVLTSILLLSFSTGEATTLLKVNLEELTNRADLIVMGVAQESLCQWDAERKRIYTYSRFVVDKVIKGDEKISEVVVKIPGGELDGVAMEVPETAEITEAGEYILFLYSNVEKHMSNVVGWRQGQFTIENGLVQENQNSVEEIINEINTILEVD
jgi:hypothetical protein